MKKHETIIKHKNGFKYIQTKHDETKIIKYEILTDNAGNISNEIIKKYTLKFNDSYNLESEHETHEANEKIKQYIKNLLEVVL